MREHGSFTGPREPSHRQRSTIARTSTVPPIRATGIRAAYAVGRPSGGSLELIAVEHASGPADRLELGCYLLLLGSGEPANDGIGTVEADLQHVLHPISLHDVNTLASHERPGDRTRPPGICSRTPRFGTDQYNMTIASSVLNGPVMIVAVRRGRVYPCAECHAAGRPTGR